MSDPRQSFHDAARLSAFLIQSLGRKPGEAMDITDVRLYQQALYPLVSAIRSGRVQVAFEPAPGGADSLAPTASPEIWQVVHFVRSAEFRPGCEVVAKKVREVLGLASEPVAGGEAQARRVVTAPLRLPWGPGPTDPPIDPDAPWIKRFARELARGDESFDTALLLMLARLPTDSARDRAISELLAAREAAATLQQDRAHGAGRTRRSQAKEKTALQAALERVAAIRKEPTRP